MKFILSLLLLISIAAESQTYKLPVKEGQRVYLRRNSTNVITLPTGAADDSIYQFVLTRIKKIPVIVLPPPPPPPPVDTTGYSNYRFEGFGKDAIGGSASASVYRVKTASEFLSALGSNRTILFDADVILTGSAARISLSNTSYLTIDGNGKNVTFDNNNEGDGISFNGSGSHHNILKGVRVINAGNDNINVIDGAHDIMIDHCSVYGSRDENFAVSGSPFAYNVTVQYTFIGGGNTSSFNGSALVGYSAKNVTFHHCLISPVTDGRVGERAPNISDNSARNFMCDFRNNVVWNWGRDGGSGSGYGTAVFNNGQANVAGNYYYTKNSAYATKATNTDDGYGNAPNGQMYADANVSGNGIDPNKKSNHAEFPIPLQYQVQMQPACDAAKKVLATVGLPFRTPYESGRINDVTLYLCN